MELQAEGLGGVAERVGLRGVGVPRVVQRIGGGADHPFDRVVVRFQVRPGDRPVLVAAAGDRLVVDEPVLVLAQQHVGEEQRAAAEAAGHQRVQAPEAPHLEHPVPSGRRVPENVGGLVRGAAEAAGRVGPAPFQHHHRLSGLGQPVGGDGSAEAGADDHGVHVLGCVCAHVSPPAA